MKLLVDMNLSPDWVPILKKHGHDVIHWSVVGSHRAPDREIMEWASKEERVVFTHDLDFGPLLAATQARSPSVIQVRVQDISPLHLEQLIVAALTQYEGLLKHGALVVVDESKLRARVLPIKK